MDDAHHGAISARDLRPASQRRLTRSIAVGLSLTVLTAGAGIALTRARAGVTYHVWTNAGPVNLRPTPSTSRAPIGQLPDKTPVHIVCTALGDTETGPYNTPTPGWDRLDDPASGPFVSDAFIYTGQMGPVAPACSGFQTWTWPLTQPGPTTGGADPGTGPFGVTGRPQTVPAVQQWRAGHGTYAFTAASRIVVDQASAAQLAKTSQTFASDLSAFIGKTIPVVPGPASSVRRGDVFLSLGSTDSALGNEGYTMAIADSIAIQGRADPGVFYGTRTLLQLLRQGGTIGAGTIRDWATYAERGVMVDVARKYYSVGWLQNEIREMAYARMNYLHLHLSDDQGFRLESTTHPEIVSQQHYTKKEIADLVAFAATYHVIIVPELDMPGHMGAMLAPHPELRISGSDLNVTNPAAVAFVEQVIGEYIPLFPAPFWHMGADETAGISAPNFYGFINTIDGFVRSKGRTLRMWNDGIHSASVNADIVVEYWAGSGLTPQQLVDAGHALMNAGYDATYHVLGRGGPSLPYLYDNWQVNQFQGGGTVAATSSKLLGADLHIWGDNPNAETEAQVFSATIVPLRAIGQKTWGSPLLATTSGAFTSLSNTVGHPGDRRGWTLPTGTVPGPSPSPSPQPGGSAAILAAVTGHPGHTTSHYESDANTTTFYNQGCTQGKAGEHGVVILDYGQPETYGAAEVARGVPSITFASIVSTAEQFASGYAHCAPSGNLLVMALGVNNDRINPLIGNSGSAAASSSHGSQWARQVSAVNAWLAGQVVNGRHLDQQILAAGAGDFEDEWGPAANATAWVDAFVASGNSFFDFGTANGCPASGGTCHINDDPNPTNTWTTDTVLHLIGGAPHTYAIPEVYWGTAPQDWAAVATYGSHKGVTARFVAVITEPGSWDAATAIRNLGALVHLGGMSDTFIPNPLR